MDLDTTLILITIFIILEAFFSGSEIGMISLNRIKMKQKAEEGDRSAQAVLTLLSSPEDLFATTSLGTNIAVVSGTSIFTAYMVTRFGDPGELWAMLLISPVILFFGEIVPKMIIQNRPDSIMLFLIRPLNMSYRVLHPAVRFFSNISNAFTRRVVKSDGEGETTFSRDQIRQVLSLVSQTIDLDISEQTMIHKIFNFGEITVEQCKVPLVQMFAVRDDTTMEEAHRYANETGYSRIPVFHDRMYNIIGILNTFDLINQNSDQTPITDLIRPAYYVPPNKKVDDLLKELQQRGLHMAIVVDEYGGCTGLTTVEDLVEEIVGEIEDEFDKPEKLYEEYSEGGFLIEANMEIDAINETLHLDLPTGDYETLAGLIIDRLEKIPQSGDQITVNGNRLTVKDASKRQVHTVIILKVPQEAETPPASSPSDTDRKND